MHNYATLQHMYMSVHVWSQSKENNCLESQASLVLVLYSEVTPVKAEHRNSRFFNEFICVYLF